jgi:hypothetical protein
VEYRYIIDDYVWKLKDQEGKQQKSDCTNHPTEEGDMKQNN